MLIHKGVSSTSGICVCVFNLKMNFYAVDTMNFTIFDIHLRWTFAQNQTCTLFICTSQPHSTWNALV